MIKNNVDVQELISEAPSMLEQSASSNNLVTNDQVHKQRKIDMFKRIDQVEISKVGIKSKTNFEENAIEEVHNFSMLQRFRQNRDFRAFDKSKPIIGTTDQNNSDEDYQDDIENVNLNQGRGNENNLDDKWWLEQNHEDTIKAKKEQAK